MSLVSFSLKKSTELKVKSPSSENLSIANNLILYNLTIFVVFLNTAFQPL